MGRIITGAILVGLFLLVNAFVVKDRIPVLATTGILFLLPGGLLIYFGLRSRRARSTQQVITEEAAPRKAPHSLAQPSAPPEHATDTHFEIRAHLLGVIVFLSGAACGWIAGLLIVVVDRNTGAMWRAPEGYVYAGGRGSFYWAVWHLLVLMVFCLLGHNVAVKKGLVPLAVRLGRRNDAKEYRALGSGGFFVALAATLLILALRG